MPDIAGLIAIFEEARTLLSRPDNDYMWSSWEDNGDALEEIDLLLVALRAGRPIDTLTCNVIFAPTGPMQEVALSSGWGDTFLLLADRFDEAMAANAGPSVADPALDDPCQCLHTPLGNRVLMKELGTDRWFAEISLLLCPGCGRNWIRYFYESEATTGSGRWYLGAILPEQLTSTTAENAKEQLEGLAWYFYGGSYYDGTVGTRSGRIILSP